MAPPTGTTEIFLQRTGDAGVAGKAGLRRSRRGLKSQEGLAWRLRPPRLPRGPGQAPQLAESRFPLLWDGAGVGSLLSGAKLALFGRLCQSLGGFQTPLTVPTVPQTQRRSGGRNIHVYIYIYARMPPGFLKLVQGDGGKRAPSPVIACQVEGPHPLAVCDLASRSLSFLICKWGPVRPPSP